MRRIKLEKVTGVVALSYLILIPVGAFYIYQKIDMIDKDVMTIWSRLEMPTTPKQSMKIMSGLKKIMGQY